MRQDYNIVDFNKKILTKLFEGVKLLAGSEKKEEMAVEAAKIMKIVKMAASKLFFLFLYYYYCAYYYISKVRAFFAAAVWGLRLRNMVKE